MVAQEPFKLHDWLMWLLIVLTALAARGWYLSEYAEDGDAPAGMVWQVQGMTKEEAREFAELEASLKEKGILHGFHARPPLAAHREPTAHTPPGYPILKSVVEGQLEHFAPENISPLATTRWLQAALGAMTAGLYFAAARRAFLSSLVGFLAGTLYAVNPFAIVNVAELVDGALASFVVALTISLGLRAGQQGGALTAILFGLSAAAMALVRGALLPFGLVTVLWFLWRARKMRYGWLYALLVLLGFINGLAPWLVRNYREYQRFIPVVSSAWWHVWIGNNPAATGGPLTPAMERHLEESGRRANLAEAKHGERYDQLAEEVWREVRENPAQTLRLRVQAAACFLAGASGAIVAAPEGLERELRPPAGLMTALYGALLGMLVLGFLGWRWSFAWRETSMPLPLAVIWIPLPYILGHAEHLHGPRLPLDGVLCCLAAVAIAWLIPGVGGAFSSGGRGIGAEEAGL